MILDTKAGRVWVHGFGALLGLASAHCGTGSGDEPTGSARQAIVGGSEAAASGSPVLYLEGPQGTCTAVLIAPTLAATARHCIAQLVEGAPSCTPEGQLLPTGSGAGEIGTDDAPSALHFFSAASAAKMASEGGSTSPDAVGIKILSTKGPSICCDDLAFVVLDHSIAGLVPASVRIDRSTEVGESVSVFGYGLTGRTMDPTVLRVSRAAKIVGVGPDEPTTVPQAAPLRALRIGPGVITCNGDSGGPVMSKVSGAVVGLVSLGTQASAAGPFCNDGTSADTTGPELADYRDLVLSAFKAAGASPILETAPPDAGAGTPPSGNGDLVSGGSCATGMESGERTGPWSAMAFGFAIVAMAAGRRKR